MVKENKVLYVRKKKEIIVFQYGYDCSNYIHELLPPALFENFTHAHRWHFYVGKGLLIILNKLIWYSVIILYNIL